MRKGVLLLALMVVAAPVYAQQSVAEAAAKSRNQAATKKAQPVQVLPADAPTREDVLKLFDVMQINKTMDAVIQAAKQQSMEMAEQMANDRVPDATAEQKKQIREMME